MSSLGPLSQLALAWGASVLLAGPWWLDFVAYPLSGAAAWLVWQRVDIGVERKRAALRWWGWQLLFSALWPATLYGIGGATPAFILVCLMFVSAGSAALAFARLRPLAAAVLLPHIAWLVLTASWAADRF